MEQLMRRLFAQNALMVSRLSALENLFVSGGIQLNPVADPAPDGGGFGGGVFGGLGGVLTGGFGGGINPVADPAPDELGKLSKIQLESRLSDIAFARTKLDQVEGLFKDALGRL
jgi:hypothetical protein